MRGQSRCRRRQSFLKSLGPFELPRRESTRSGLLKHQEQIGSRPALAEQLLNGHSAEGKAMTLPKGPETAGGGSYGLVNRPFMGKTRPETVQCLIERLIRGMGQPGIDRL